MNNIKLPDALGVILRQLKTNGFQAYIVGGALRDVVLNKSPKDYDVATDATPEDVIRVFEQDYTIVSNAKDYGVISIVADDNMYEVATLRKEGEYKDNRRPSEVVYTKSLIEDLARRDFTINAMAYDPIDDKIYDPFDASSDFHDKIIRCVGEPDQRFGEDALRILRCLRFAIQLSFYIDNDTIDGVLNNKEKLEFISAERKRDELIKVLVNINTPYLNYLSLFLSLLEINPDEYNIDNLIKAPDDIISKLATLLLEYDTDSARDFLKKYKFSNKIVKNVLLVHKYLKVLIKPNPALHRQIANKVGLENLERILQLQKYNINDNMKVFQGIQEDSIYIKDLMIDGNDLLDINIPQQHIGTILNLLLEEVLINQFANNTNDLLKQAKKYKEELDGIIKE